MVRPDYTASRYPKLVCKEIEADEVTKWPCALSRIWPNWTVHERLGKRQILICRGDPELNLVFREMICQLRSTSEWSQRALPQTVNES